MSFLNLQKLINPNTFELVIFFVGPFNIYMKTKTNTDKRYGIKVKYKFENIQKEYLPIFFLYFYVIAVILTIQQHKHSRIPHFFTYP